MRLSRGAVLCAPPVVVNGSRRQYVFDTGANLSTIMRSEAANLGLRIIPAQLDVGTSTATRRSCCVRREAR